MSVIILNNGVNLGSVSRVQTQLQLIADADMSGDDIIVYNDLSIRRLSCIEKLFWNILCFSCLRRCFFGTSTLRNRATLVQLASHPLFLQSPGILAVYQQAVTSWNRGVHSRRIIQLNPFGMPILRRNIAVVGAQGHVPVGGGHGHGHGHGSFAAAPAAVLVQGPAVGPIRGVSAASHVAVGGGHVPFATPPFVGPAVSPSMTVPLSPVPALPSSSQAVLMAPYAQRHLQISPAPGLLPSSVAAAGGGHVPVGRGHSAMGAPAVSVSVASPAVGLPPSSAAVAPRPLAGRVSVLSGSGNVSPHVAATAQRVNNMAMRMFQGAGGGAPAMMPSPSAPRSGPFNPASVGGVSVMMPGPGAGPAGHVPVGRRAT